MNKSELRELVVSLEWTRDYTADKIRELQDRQDTLTTLIIGIHEQLEKMTEDEVTECTTHT